MKRLARAEASRGGSYGETEAVLRRTAGTSCSLRRTGGAITSVLVRSSRYGEGGCHATRHGGGCLPCQQAQLLALGDEYRTGVLYGLDATRSRCGVF
jgi:hypothetical protein